MTFAQSKKKSNRLQTGTEQKDAASILWLATVGHRSRTKSAGCSLYALFSFGETYTNGTLAQSK